MIRIKVTHDRDEPRAYRFEGDRVRIGRSEDNDVVLRSEACSRHHAEVVRGEQGYQILDQGSANGLLVDGETLTSLDLADGSRVEIAGYVLVFSIEEEGDGTLIPGDGVVEAGGASRDGVREPRVLYLLYREGDRTRSLKVVEGAQYVLGRGSDADLVIDDKKSSKRHATLLWRAAQLWIRDDGSSNGTRVDGEKVQEKALEVGSEILVGSTAIVVRDERRDLTDESELAERTHYGLRAPDAGDEASSVVGKGGGRGVALAVAVAVALAVGAFLLLTGASEEPTDVTGGDASQGEELAVQLATIETGELTRSIDGTGRIVPATEVTVSAEESGRIAAIEVEEGAPVRPGGLLARLDDGEIRLQLAEARSAASEDRVDMARQEYQRQQELLEEGISARAAVDAARDRYLSLESAYESAQARIGQLQRRLDRTRITSPISGRVTRRFANAGEVVSPGAALFQLENADLVQLRLELSDRDVVRVELGLAVDVTTDAFPERVFRGAVEAVSSAADPVTRTFEVEARIDNSDGSLRSGMIASFRIVLEATRGLVVPEEALFDRSGPEANVFVVRDGVARRTPVRLGGQYDRRIEVLGGLTEGDEVVVYGKERVRDGERVGAFGRR